MNTPVVTVVGAGMAGCEAAWQLASRGVRVKLVEMKPVKRTPAQVTDGFAELVCSNSLRGAALSNAVGLLKAEMRLAGSLFMRCADATRVPSGGAHAVDREKFSAEMEAAMRSHPLIEVVCAEMTELPGESERPVIVATGPLTEGPLAAALERAIGSTRLAYYDAISPIVSAESLDWSKVWRQSRYGKGNPAPAPTTAMDAREAELTGEAPEPEAGAEPEAGGDDAYVNCPFDKEQYLAFVRALVEAEKVQPHAFEEPKYFEGCLPCEVMAERGERTLSFGPMKPVGLIDPRTGRRPWAVVQLRPEDAAATAYNLVGFQTRMKWGEQARVFKMIPGLEEAEFLRFGSVHRNTFVDAPHELSPELELSKVPGVYLAGQITGVEGYVESAACGLLVGLFLARKLLGEPIVRPPVTTALGGLLTHLSRHQPKYQPSNITWAQVPPLEGVNKKLKKRDRYEALSLRAVADHEAWLVAAGLAPAAPHPPAPSPLRGEGEGNKDAPNSSVVV